MQKQESTKRRRRWFAEGITCTNDNIVSALVNFVYIEIGSLCTVCFAFINESINESRLNLNNITKLYRFIWKSNKNVHPTKFLIIHFVLYEKKYISYLFFFSSTLYLPRYNSLQLNASYVMQMSCAIFAYKCCLLLL